MVMQGRKKKMLPTKDTKGMVLDKRIEMMEAIVNFRVASDLSFEG